MVLRGDYSWGIITADPCADAPVLRFVPLPPTCALRCKEASGVLDMFRYVGVSTGKLRFVDTEKFAIMTIQTMPFAIIGLQT
jgi:hypothetical protein